MLPFLIVWFTPFHTLAYKSLVNCINIWYFVSLRNCTLRSTELNCIVCVIWPLWLSCCRHHPLDSVFLHRNLITNNLITNHCRRKPDLYPTVDFAAKQMYKVLKISTKNKVKRHNKIFIFIVFSFLSEDTSQIKNVVLELRKGKSLTQRRRSL